MFISTELRYLWQGCSLVISDFCHLAVANDKISLITSISLRGVPCYHL